MISLHTSTISEEDVVIPRLHYRHSSCSQACHQCAKNRCQCALDCGQHAQECGQHAQDCGWCAQECGQHPGLWPAHPELWPAHPELWPSHPRVLLAHPGLMLAHPVLLSVQPGAPMVVSQPHMSLQILCQPPQVYLKATALVPVAYEGPSIGPVNSGIWLCQDCGETSPRHFQRLPATKIHFADVLNFHTYHQI